MVDTETVLDGDELRLVSLGVVTCRSGLVRGKWQSLVNPGVPVDEDSARVHGLTEDHLAGEPVFADVAPTLLAALQPRGEETVVFVSHNVSFDVTVLRGELKRLGTDLPDISVLDTMGRLPALVGVHPQSASLGALCEALAISHERAHDALYDAVMCAESVVELLSRAAAMGDDNLDVLLLRAGSVTTHTVVPFDPKKAFGSARAHRLPAEHLASHGEFLGRRAGARRFAQWHAEVAECAALRCRHLEDRVANAEPARARLLAELEAVLHEQVAAGDTAGAATVLGATLPLVGHIPPRSGRLGLRNAALAWAGRWGPLFAGLGRCDEDDQCPACRRHEPCPLDVWPEAVGRVALGDPERHAPGFFETKGRDAGTGAYTEWCRQGHKEVADAALALCMAHWRSVGQNTRAQQLAQLAWKAGCQHPDVVDAYAANIGAAGKEDDLANAVRTCDQTLRKRGDSTHDGWVRLEARRNQLAGRAARLKVRLSGKVDATLCVNLQ